MTKYTYFKSQTNGIFVKNVYAQFPNSRLALVVELSNSWLTICILIII